jgi:hypothetical protein
MTKRVLQASWVVVASAVLLAAVTPTVVSTQTGTKPDMITKAEAGRGGADANIKNDSAANVKGKPSTAPKPPEKTGETARGTSLCSVMFDNYTDLYIKTFVDGDYTGTMRPMGELNTYAIAGPTILYARADYTDGSSVSWGPIKVQCNTRYRWRLTN